MTTALTYGGNTRFLKVGCVSFLEITHEFVAPCLLIDIHSKECDPDSDMVTGHTLIPYKTDKLQDSLLVLFLSL